MIVYHGSNATLDEIRQGIWVTTDIHVARDFAIEKAADEGGSPVVAAIDVDESSIDWDALGGVSGVEDERGVLLHPIAAMAWTEVRHEVPSIP